MKKKFSLLPILKIREYKEYVELQNFAKIIKDDVKLASEYNSIDAAMHNVAARVKQDKTEDFQMLRDVHEFLSACEVRKRDIVAAREKLKPIVDKARAQYASVHKDAEVLRIARDAHDTLYKSAVTKKFFEELQEKQLCRK